LPPALAGGSKMHTKKALAKIAVLAKALKSILYLIPPAKAGGYSNLTLNQKWIFMILSF
jgi:hypothetical protein